MSWVDGFDKVTRVELIDNSGRLFSRWDIGNVKVLLSDDDRTLKVFIEEDVEEIQKEVFGKK